MRATRATATALAAALVVAVLAGCAGDGATGRAERPAAPGSDEAGASDDGTEGSTAPVEPSLPIRPLQSAAVTVVGDEVWIVGGVAGYDPYETNPAIVRRSASGEILGTVPLDLARGEALLAGAPPIVIGDDTYLQGSRCPISPRAENGPCGEVEPTLHRVDADGLVPVAVPPSWAEGPPNTPGSFGFPPWAVGAVGDRLVTTAAVGEGPIPGATEQVEVALVDPATGTATTVPTVPGVVTASSVCADGERIWSMAPTIDADRHVAGVDVWAQDDPIGAAGAAPRRVATIGLDRPRGITRGQLNCGDGFVVVTGSGDGGAFAVVDTDTGAVVGDVTDWDDWGTHVGVPDGGDGSRLVMSRTPDVDERALVTHQLVTQDGVSALPDGEIAEWGVGLMPPLRVVEVDGRLLDVGAWLAEPDVEQPPIALD